MPKLDFIMLLVVLLSSISALTSEVKEENYLVQLDDTNFDSTLKEKDAMLVLFQSNQCLACIELLPTLSTAAALLARSATSRVSPTMRVGLALVNSTAWQRLAARYGIDADAVAPVLKLFKPRSSPTPEDYTGPIGSAEEIAEHVRTAAASEADVRPVRLTESNLTEALAQRPHWLVAFVDAASSLDYAIEGLKLASTELRSGKIPVAFGYADARGNEEAMAKRHGLQTDSLPVFALLNRDEPDWAIPFSHQLSGANLAKFCRAHLSPASAELRAKSARVYATPAPLDSMDGGMDAHLVASESAAAPVRRFLAAFLAESGYFFDRRLDGGLLATPAAQGLGMSLDAIYVRLSPNLLTTGESGMARYPGPLFSSPSLKAFFDRRSLPRLGLLLWHTRRAYMSAPGRSVCLFYCSSLPSSWQGEAGQQARRTHAKLAALIDDREDLALFAMASDEQELTESGRFGFDESSSDVNLGCYDSARRRFAMPESDGPDPAAVRSFLDSFAAGTAPQRLRSASVPLGLDDRSGGGGGGVLTANANRLKRLLRASSDDGARILLIQCDFSTQPCGQSIKEFAAAANDSAALLGNKVRFVRVDTKFNDLPGELYYRFDGEAAVELSSKQPQVLLLIPGEPDQPGIVRYERDVVAKAYLLQFLATNNEPYGASRQEL